MEQFIIGAVSAMSATVLSNPLEVVKTRFQLQGELRSKGHYTVYYKGFFHAMYIIAKTDGLLALQKGLVPALWHQLFMNGIRLGGFQTIQNTKWNLKENGEIDLPRTALLAGMLGVVTAYTGSPFYLVKIQMQARSSDAIAVGTQHSVESGTFRTLKSIYQKNGIKGLWRGCAGSVPRRFFGSTTQLVSFSYSKQFLATNSFYQIERGNLNSFISSFIGGFVVTVVMNPLDVISTRLYNQGVDSSGKGLLYNSYFDCVRKIYKTEGLPGYYKGFVPMFIRTGPHNVLVLLFWDIFKNNYDKLTTK